MKTVEVVLVLLSLLWCYSVSVPSAHGQGRKESKHPGTTSSFISRTGSSVVLPIHGNVYPRGFYHVVLYIGQPPKPYFLDPDTGSDLTWLQCDAPCVRCTKAPHPLYRPSNERVVCKDPICASLHPPGQHKCDIPEQCDYEVEYEDGGSSLGVLVKDLLTLNFIDGTRLSSRLAFGCGYDQLPSASSHPIDGVLGLGRGKSSITSQLHQQGLIRNVIGHCLSSRGGGFLFFGDDVFDSSRIIWTQMSSDYLKYYSPGLAELVLSGKATGLRNLRVVFDSGSSYTYLSSQAYKFFLDSVMKELSGRQMREALDDWTLPVCFKGTKPFKNMREVAKLFKPIALSFASDSGKTKAAAQFDISPEAYLVISSKGNACLGILNGTQIGLQNLNLIGDISMQDKMVIYDNEKQAIGWLSTDCDGIPKSRSRALSF